MANIATIPVQPTQVVDTRYTQDVIPVLDTGKFEHMQRIAMMMATCAYVPADLTKGNDDRAKISNCFLIVNQAVRWNMDPFALAQGSYFVSGKIGFDGKVIAAAINSDPRLKGRLDYTFEGEGDSMKITVSGTFRDTGETKIITGTVAKWKTKQGLWGKDDEQALVYRGSRQWARRWMPDRLLGIYSSDELDDMLSRDVPSGQRALRMKDITPAPLSIPDIPDEPAKEAATKSSRAGTITAETADNSSDVPDREQDKEPADLLADPEGFLAKLADDIALCESAEELAEIAESNARTIARLPVAQKKRAAEMLTEAAQ